MQKQIIQTKCKTARVWSQPKINKKVWHTNLPQACTTCSRRSLSTNNPPNTDPHDNDPTPHQLSHGGSNKCLGCCCFLVWLPRRLFSNLRTACSETLMLRERKASMADRSLSSLTGELLLLATAAAAFATLAARRLDGDEYPWRGEGNRPRLAIWWRWAVRGWIIVRVVAVVWQCWGKECDVWRYTRRQQEPRAPEQAASDQRAHATQGEGYKGQDHKGQRVGATEEGRGQE